MVIFMGTDGLLKGFYKEYLGYAKWLVIPLALIFALDMVLN